MRLDDQRLALPEAALLGALVLAGSFLVSTARAEPVLRRVVLSSGGVGQFEFEADVDGNAALNLDVPLAQVDDVLKSLVVDDPAGPSSGVRLPGRQPLAESFRTLPFKPEAFASSEALLGSLVGEHIKIPKTGVQGSILAVSAVVGNEAGGGGFPARSVRHRLTIATSDGIQSMVLEDTPDIEFSSAALRSQIAQALDAIAAQRVQDRRTLVLQLAQGGRRHVRFGYVVQAPVWKTTYRITQQPDGATHGSPSGVARLQAFAVVENLSGRDWNNVSVVLTSGRPVLFHTPLYQAMMAQRPEAPLDLGASLIPQLDEAEPGTPSPRPARFGLTEGMPPPPPAMAAPPPPFIPPADIPIQPPPPPVQGRMMFAGETPEGPPPTDISQSVAQVEFRLAAPVTAPSGQSLLLPILDRAIPAERIALFQQASNSVHPLVALKLTNDSTGAMPPGLVTLFERHNDGSLGYVGDARIPAIEPGEDKLASFASDLGVTVDVQRNSSQVTTGAQISKGVIYLKYRLRDVTSYRVTTPKSGSRTLLVEQPKIDGYDLTDPSGKDVTTTPQAYRVSRDIPAGTTQTVSLVMEHTAGDQIDIGQKDTSQMRAWSVNGAIPQAVRNAVARAASLKQDLDSRNDAVSSLEDRINAIVTDQDRVRKNLASVPPNSDLQRRYLGTLQIQENDLASLRSQADAARKQAAQADATLKTYLASLNL